MSSLDLTLLFLLAAVLGVVLFRSLKLPAILAYLSVGVLIGPNALALAKGSGSVGYLAEFGVVFLMFVIGLEFSLPKLRRDMRYVFGLGGGQVLGVMLCMSALLLLGFHFSSAYTELSWRTALVLAGIMAMSSTAIVGKMMTERQELQSEHGKRVMGVLLFQDLAVVPLLVLIPALSSPPERLFMALGLAFVKAAIIITVLLIGGAWLMRKWLHLVAKRKSDELFMLNLLLVTLGLAWLTEHAGLSMALGAFIAGMLISETEFKHRVEIEIKPIHDVLLGLFFITIGMLLDWAVLLERWQVVLILLLIPMAFKFAWVWFLAKTSKAGDGVSLRTGLYLAQMGEFGFVLLNLSAQHQLVPPELFNPMLAAMVLSMLATPFLIMHSNSLVLKIASNEWLAQSLQMTSIAKKSISIEEHVIICGYGRSGQNMAKILTQEEIAYIALDTDTDRVRQASAAGDAVVYGDATRPQALMAAGLARAATVVITFSDVRASLKVLACIHEHAPQVKVVVRTLDDHDIETLQNAGAHEIVPEAVEGSLMLASQVLALQGVPVRRVIRIIQEQRDARYQLLRGFFHGSDDDDVFELAGEHLLTVELSKNSQAIGKSIADMQFEQDGVLVVAIRRKEKGIPNVQTLHTPEPTTLLQAGDTLVISGKPEALTVAAERLQKDA